MAILIDAAQDLDEDELAARCSIAHTAGQDGWALLVALAGLPSLPRILADAKSYSERLFILHPIEHPDDPLAARALTEPAALEPVSWSEDAALHVVREASGFPGMADFIMRQPQL